MKILTYRDHGQEKLGLCVDSEIYDLDAVCASVKEVKAFSKPRFFDRPIVGMSMLELIELGDAGLKILGDVERYIRWQEISGDPWVLRHARRNEEEVLLVGDVDFGVSGSAATGTVASFAPLPGTRTELHRWISEHPAVGPSPGAEAVVPFIASPPAGLLMRTGLMARRLLCLNSIWRRS